MLPDVRRDISTDFAAGTSRRTALAALAAFEEPLVSAGCAPSEVYMVFDLLELASRREVFIG
jgi:hypothetical protein